MPRREGDVNCGLPKSYSLTSELVAIGARAAAHKSGTHQVPMLCYGLPRTSGVCWRAGKTFVVATLQICGAGVRCGHRGAADHV